MKTTRNLRSLIVARSALVIFCACGLQGLEASPPTPTASVEVDKNYERSVLGNLWPVLRTTNKAGRIYYQAVCPSDEHYPLAFRRVDVRPPSRDATDLAAVRSIFREQKGVLVAEYPPGIIRVRIGRVPDAILRTQISTLNLTPTERYNSFAAIWAIENAPEVRSAAKKLHIVVPVRVVNMPTVRPAEGLPHLPPQLSNVTMDQALDLVARTWSGIVLYGVCTPPATYEVSFAEGIYTRGSGLVSSTNSR